MKDLIEFNLETAVDAWNELRIGKGVDAISDCDEFFPSTLGFEVLEMMCARDRKSAELKGSVLLNMCSSVDNRMEELQTVQCQIAVDRARHACARLAINISKHECSSDACLAFDDDVHEVYLVEAELYSEEALTVMSGVERWNKIF